MSVQDLKDSEILDPELDPGHGSGWQHDVVLFVVFVKNLPRPTFFNNVIHFRS